MLHPLRMLTSQWNQRTQPLIAQEKPSPDQHANDDREEERFAGAHVGSGCAAEIACHQDRTKNGGPRDSVDDRAGYFDDADGQENTLRIPKVNESSHGHSRLKQS